MPKDSNQSDQSKTNERLVYNQAWKTEIKYPDQEEIQKITSTTSEEPKYEFQEGYVN